MASLLSRLRSLALSTLLVLAGTAATGTDAMALTCPASQVKDGALCYAKPRAGYSCHATLCVANCPDGYHSSGIGTCHYSGTLTYTQRPYVSRSHSNMQRCLALFYNDCRSGYRMNVCGICAYGGAWDTTRHSYDRGPGVNPDANAAFNRLSDTARATWGKALQGVENAYNDALAAFNNLDDVLKQALLDQAKAVATQLAQDSAPCLKSMQAQLVAMTHDPEMSNTMKRVVAAAAAGKKSPDNLADVTAIVKRLKFCSLPRQFQSGVTLSVYGAYTAVAGAGVSGSAGVLVGLTMGSSNPDPEIYAFVSNSLVLGAMGEAGGIGIAIESGRPQARTQNFMAGGVEVADLGGANVSVGVSLPARLPPFDPLKPDPATAVASWVGGLVKSGAFIAIAAELGEVAGLPFEFGKQTSFRLY